MPDDSLISRSFDELKNSELYDLLALRTDIFVVEQECPYPELDQQQPVIFYFIQGKTWRLMRERCQPTQFMRSQVLGG